MPDTYLISRLSTCREKHRELAATLIHAAAQISSLSCLLLPHSTERKPSYQELQPGKDCLGIWMENEEGS